MHDWASLSHLRWDCKYQFVFVPKYCRKKLYGKFRKRVGDILSNLCRVREVELLEELRQIEGVTHVSLVLRSELSEV